MSFVCFIIAMILILNGHGGWAVAFFVIGILGAIGGKNED